MRTTIEKAAETYGVASWGSGYIEINRKGNLVVKPAENEDGVDLKEVVDDLVKRGITPPLLIRFPQILANQVRRLHRSFKGAIREFDYEGRHRAVFPMKVNPRREVLEEFLKEGGRYDYGLEAGSKAELYAALSMPQADDGLLLCNGFKDAAFMELALMGRMVGKNVIITLEKLSELKIAIAVADKLGVRPAFGIRAKLYSKGSGKWEESGGETAKFGLTTSEILEVLRYLGKRDMLDTLKVLHFHIGSQITDIKRIKNAMKEAARVYAKIRQKGINIEYLNVGGGMAVDYDGSRTSYESSANYSMQEFANDVIFTIKSVCDDEDVPEPNLITESGRIMSAYHAMLVVNVTEEIETYVENVVRLEPSADDPTVVGELFELYDSINAKNYREYYHDAQEHKDEMFTMFNLGLISLEDRALGESLFWEISAKALKYAQNAKYVPEEFEELKSVLAARYLCNFSVFRSVPDHWAIEQLFPILPIHKLKEPATEFVTLCDITCDSDGRIDKFVDLHDVKKVLEIHPFDGSPYYLGIFLVGAYQEVMGNYHNLFGRPNEAHVIVERDGAYHIKKTTPGSTIGNMLDYARYDRDAVRDRFFGMVDARVKNGDMSEDVSYVVKDRYDGHIKGITYLV
ncbi:MAG TPA: biosynthetic arginine decarboxylase [Blastocatellia bacterium]|nr:biosynthetic arginine decarboxylase [Blastocatellia bacterium]